MAWTQKQIQLAQIARNACNWNDPHYHMILRNVAGVRPVLGKISSTNPTANNAGFERFMAYAESQGFTDRVHGLWYWTQKANAQCDRMYHKIEALAAEAAALRLISADALPPFVERMTAKREGGPTSNLRECGGLDTYNILEGLKAWTRKLAKERGLRLAS